MTLLPLLARHWRAVAAGAAILLLTILVAVRTGERDHARRDLAAERAASALFAEQVRASAARIRADMAARALDAERRQNRISEEVSNDYQARISDLNRRVAALRLRAGTSAAGAGGTRGPARMSGLSGAARGPDAAAGEDGLPAGPLDRLGTGGSALAFDDAVIATEQAIRLEALQDWVRRQAAARTPD